VTNRDYKRFVDAGGYRAREYWTEPFVKDGRSIAWDEGLRLMVDQTGRPGPSTWELGSYPQGQDEFPVRGVSWYEAAAYARFAGKRLPSLHHWRRAASAGNIYSDILEHSNFSAKGPVAVGTYPGIGAYGTYDMAGNVKEWCANGWEGKRYVAGGSWSDPAYLYAATELADPWDRRPTNGFRCAKAIATIPPELTEAVLLDATEDLSTLEPVGDEAFRVYAGLYAYEKMPLRSRVERVDDSAAHWRRETVSFDAAYGGERVRAHLYLPRNARPPYQTVLYFPDSSAEAIRSSEDPFLRWVEFVIRSGRALMFPVYKGTYERKATAVVRPSEVVTARRDLLLAWSKDVGRSLDYLESRNDIAGGTVALYGFSLGAVYAPVLCTMEPRLKTCIIVGGGLPARRLPPEAEPINFAPRLKMPVLMIGGKDDFVRPVATAQMPLFRRLGTPEKDKRLALLEGGHLPPTLNEMIREILDWLDRYQGPVQKSS
jgi:predicted esterase